MSKPKFHAGWLAALLLVIVLLPVAYVGAYFGMLDNGWVNLDTSYAPYGPEYRSDLPVVEVVFRPAHELDRIVRPVHWQ